MQCVCSSPPYLQNQHHKCCIWKVSFLHELLSHNYSNCFYLKNSYHKSRSSVSSITYTALKIVFFSKTTNAKVALHFPSFMNWCIESVQVSLTYKTSITNVAFERFLSFMNCFHIFIQISFIWKTLITKVVVQSLVSHILHWKGFLPSWTTSIWFFKLFYLKFWNWD
jgi:hypothetical protein